MVRALAQTTQNIGKCPHGYPIGACPICNGMSGGGASKDRNKPRKAGEMSYNECLAQWHKMQAQKEARIQDRLDRVQNYKQSVKEARLMLELERIRSKVTEALNKFMEAVKIVKTPLKAIQNIFQNVVLNPIRNFISTVQNFTQMATKYFQEFSNNVRQFIGSVAEKLSTLLGEIKNFVDARILQKLPKKIKMFLSLKTEEEQEEQEEKEKVQEEKLVEIKQILKSFFRIKSKKEQEEKDESEFV